MLADTARLATLAARGEQIEIDLVERQETFQFGGDLEKSRLEGRVDVLHHGVIDVALDLRPVERFDLVGLEDTVVQNRHAGFFHVGHVHEHGFRHLGFASSAGGPVPDSGWPGAIPENGSTFCQ